MALIESLGNAISGMISQQTAIDVISNNIANVNTSASRTRRSSSRTSSTR
ncbi:MAG: hypothetical protein FJX76_18555 [Armatimonadetes bacterium]|nr:hypothetical protein [Armatimonadota bacterium]